MGKWILLFTISIFFSSITNAGTCFFNYSKIQCVEKIENKTYQFDCPQGTEKSQCEKLAVNYFSNKKREIAEAKKQPQQQSSGTSGSNSNSGYDTASNGLSTTSGLVSTYAGLGNEKKQPTEEFGSAYQQDQVIAGHGANKNGGSAAGGGGAAGGGAAAKDPQAAAQEYFKETEIAMNYCENSWHSLVTNNCSATGSTTLNTPTTALPTDATKEMLDSAKSAATAASVAAASALAAKGDCQASLFKCGGLCKDVRVKAEKDLELCNSQGATAHATSMCANFSSDQAMHSDCMFNQSEIFKKNCTNTASSYTAGASSSVKKCYVAGAAFLAIIAGGIIAIKKYKDKAKALKSEVESNSEEQSDTSTSPAQTEKIMWNNGRHEMQTSTNSSQSGVDGSSTVLGSSSRKIADPNPKSDLNFKGYDPNQEYAASSSDSSSATGSGNGSNAGASGLSQKMNGSSASISGNQKVMGTTASGSAQGASGVGAVAGGGSGSGGSNSALANELGAYAPGGSRDPAAQINQAQLRTYNEARKQIRFAHSPSNFKAVRSAYDREKNRMGINATGVGN